MTNFHSKVEVCSFCEGYAVVKIENVEGDKVKSITIEKCPKGCRNGYFK